MQDLSLVVCVILAVLMLIVFVAWLTVIVLLIILLPIYLLSVLRPAIRKIVLRSKNEFVHSKSIATRRPIISDEDAPTSISFSNR